MLRIPLLLIACLSCLRAQGSAEQFSEKAAEFARRGDFKNAETQLRKAIALSPDDPEFLTSLGGILGMEGQLEEANIYLGRAAKLQPNEPVLRRNLAANEWQLGRFQQAQEDLEWLLQANPEDEGAVFLLGMVSENEKNYSRSIRLLESIPHVAERQPEALVALASSYYHTNQRERARAMLQKLLGRSANPQILSTAGHVSMDARDYALARTILAEAGRALPDSYQVFSMMAEAEMKLRYFSQAVNSAQRAVKLHSSLETKRQLATAWWRAGNRAQSVAEFESLTREFPQDPATCELFGMLLLEDGSRESKNRAIELLKQAIALNDSSSEALYQVANIELADGRLDQALKHLEGAIQVDPDDSRLHYALSRVYRRLDRNSDAEQEMKTYQKLKAAKN